MWKIDPIRAHLARRLSIGEQAAAIRADLPRVPDYVFGYCTGALLAAAVAAHCRAAGEIEPHVALFDPDPITPSYLDQEFAVLAERLGGEPSAATGGPRAIERYEAAIQSRRHALQAEQGGDSAAAEVADLLLRRHQAWLRFLAAGALEAPVDLTSVVSVFTARSELHLAPILSRPERRKVYRFDAPDGALLSDPDVRLQVARLLHR